MLTRQKKNDPIESSTDELFQKVSMEDLTPPLIYLMAV